MKHGMPILLVAMGAATMVAHAQQPAGDLNATQLQGRQVFAQSCGVCHLPPSLNAKTYGPPLNKASGSGNEQVVRAIIVNGTPRMPAFKHYLKPSEIDAIIAYLKTVPPQATGATGESTGAPE